MKKLLISLVVFSVLFVIGCQENSITDPTSVESINKSQNLEGDTHGTIPLDGILVVPGLGNSYYSIEGDISYTHALVLVDPAPPAPQYYVSLNLSVNAVLTNPDMSGNNSWIISGETEDVFYVSEDGIYLLVKYFPVQRREDGLTLVCRFLVTTDGVGLNAMWLSFGADIPINKSIIAQSDNSNISTGNIGY